MAINEHMEAALRMPDGSLHLSPDERIREMIQRVIDRVGSDDGSGDIGIIVRLALRDDPHATVADIAEIVREAREDYSAERERE